MDLRYILVSPASSIDPQSKSRSYTDFDSSHSTSASASQSFFTNESGTPELSSPTSGDSTASTEIESTPQSDAHSSVGLSRTLSKNLPLVNTRLLQFLESNHSRKRTNDETNIRVPEEHSDSGSPTRLTIQPSLTIRRAAPLDDHNTRNRKRRKLKLSSSTDRSESDTSSSWAGDSTQDQSVASISSNGHSQPAPFVHPIISPTSSPQSESLTRTSAAESRIALLLDREALHRRGDGLSISLFYGETCAVGYSLHSNQGITAKFRKEVIRWLQVVRHSSTPDIHPSYLILT